MWFLIEPCQEQKIASDLDPEKQKLIKLEHNTFIKKAQFLSMKELAMGNLNSNKTSENKRLNICVFEKFELLLYSYTS